MIPEQLWKKIESQKLWFDDIDSWILKIDDLKDILERYFKEEPKY